MGKGTNTGPFNITEGGAFTVYADNKPTPPQASSGATEPAWPGAYQETVVDGGITWTAIYARKAQGTVIGVLSPQIIQHDKSVYPAHYFQYGYVTWNSGANAGRTIAVRDSMGPQPQAGGAPTLRPYIFLLELCPNPIAIGDTFTAVVGCNKMRLKCQDFNNFANFRGFPDMPTEERALQTPNIMEQGYAPSQTK